jgi:hypothetical protein
VVPLISHSELVTRGSGVHLTARTKPPSPSRSPGRERGDYHWSRLDLWMVLVFLPSVAWTTRQLVLLPDPRCCQTALPTLRCIWSRCSARYGRACIRLCRLCLLDRQSARSRIPGMRPCLVQLRVLVHSSAALPEQRTAQGGGIRHAPSSPSAIHG